MQLLLRIDGVSWYGGETAIVSPFCLLAMPLLCNADSIQPQPLLVPSLVSFSPWLVGERDGSLVFSLAGSSSPVFVLPPLGFPYVRSQSAQAGPEWSHNATGPSTVQLGKWSVDKRMDNLHGIASVPRTPTHKFLKSYCIGILEPKMEHTLS